MAPDIVNNSWSGGTGENDWYREVVREWINAEIFPEFSAGNTGLLNPAVPVQLRTLQIIPRHLRQGQLTT